ncbi:energy transducer TonB [Belliella marina]|uniref:Energy transducer TonB n=1 Tax=Belliella marina TaxID=1644146 RepID=A0ABW4VIZ7_9BACT
MDLSMIHRTILFSAFFVLFYNTNCYSQERVITPLNEHFFAVNEGSDDHHYNKIESTSKTGESIEKIYNLENKLIAFKKARTADSLGTRIFIEVEQKFSLTGKLEQSRLKYSNSDSTRIFVIVEEEIILDLHCQTKDKCEGIYIQTTGEEEFVDRNIFHPSFTSYKLWEKFLLNNLTYPLVARIGGHQGKVFVGIKIDHTGELSEIKFMNSHETHSSLKKEVERILRKYKGGFIPARSIDGQYISAWMYFPVKFSLG